MDKRLKKKRRSREDIVARILELVCEGHGRTQILSRANLSFRLFDKYMKKMVEEGFIRPDGRFYVLTDKGVVYLGKYSEYRLIVNIITSNELVLQDKKASLINLLNNQNPLKLKRLPEPEHERLNEGI